MPLTKSENLSDNNRDSRLRSAQLGITIHTAFHPHYAPFSVEIGRWPIVKPRANPHQAWDGVRYRANRLRDSNAASCLILPHKFGGHFRAAWKTRRTSTLSSRTRYGTM